MSNTKATHNLALRIIIALIGIIFTGIGAGLMLKMGLGSSAVTSSYDGFSKVTGLTPGTISIIVSLVNIVAAWILKKDNVGIATILFMFGTKYPIDLIYDYFPRPDSFILRLIISTIALVIIGSGASLCGATKLGYGPYDSFLMSFQYRTKFNYLIMRYCWDGAYLLAAFLMGGAIGVGTVLSLLLMGPVFSTSRKIWNKIVKFD